MEYLLLLIIPALLVRAHELYLWYYTYYVLWPQIEIAYPSEMSKLGTRGWYSSNFLFQAEIGQYLIAKEYLKLGDLSLNEKCDYLSKWYTFYYRWQLVMAPAGFIAIWVAGGLFTYLLITSNT